MSQDQQNRNAGDDQFFRKGSHKRVDGTLDQAGAVVERDDPYAGGQPGLKLLDAFLDGLGDRERILAVAHHHDAADGLVVVLFQHAATVLRSKLHGGEVANVNRYAAAFGHHHVFQVAHAANPPNPADEVFRIGFEVDLAPDRDIAAGNRVKYRSEGEVVGAKLVRIDVDLILTNEAADAGHLGYAGHIELITNIPILDRAELVDAVTVAFDGVPENLPQRRGIRGEIRHNALWQKRAGDVQTLQHPRARKVEVGLVVEDDVDHREVEFAR